MQFIKLLLFLFVFLSLEFFKLLFSNRYFTSNLNTLNLIFWTEEPWNYKFVCSMLPMTGQILTLKDKPWIKNVTIAPLGNNIEYVGISINQHSTFGIVTSIWMFKTGSSSRCRNMTCTLGFPVYTKKVEFCPSIGRFLKTKGNVGYFS